MNSSDFLFMRDKDVFENLLHKHIASRPQLRTLKTQREYRTFIRNFRRWWLSDGEPELTQKTFLEWMLHGVRTSTAKNVGIKVVALKRFLTFLVEQSLLPDNPLAAMRDGYRWRGYRGIVRDLKRTGSVAAVIALADYPFSGPLGPSCLAYLDFLTALGKKCDNHRTIILSFESFLRKQNVTAWKQLDQVQIKQWLTQCRRSPSAYQRRCRLLVLEDLFLFLMNRGDAAVSPVPPPGPHRRRSLPPYVFTRDEVRAILDEACKMPDHRLMPFRGRTYRMVFLALYTLGLRISEALNLHLYDLDFTQHSLTIGRTKFYKGRVLPFGLRYEAALRAYIDENPLLRGAGREAFLFPTDSHRTPHLVNDSVYRTLRRIVNHLGIVTPAQTRPPNLHSFRHSFAVHRVEQWLREGADVEAKLPLLSAFLGHVDAAATQVYLTMTPERLRLIGKRFEAAVGREAII